MIKLIMATAAIFAVFIQKANWKSDAANAKVTFTVKGPFGTVNGSFSGLKTEVKFDENDLTGSSVTASIETASVSTGIGLRNRDLRKKDEWLNTDKYPQITFHSKKIEKTSAGFKAVGDLTIKGITKPIEIPFTFSSKEDTGLFKGQFSIKREDFQVGSKTGGSVGSSITLILEVPVKK
ncbi:MAG: YceI family protein [Chitinophagaceae bacterium]